MVEKVIGGAGAVRATVERLGTRRCLHGSSLIQTSANKDTSISGFEEPIAPTPFQSLTRDIANVSTGSSV